jgi:molybdenum-dependent DNA-binding transcriptional regulator ModE
MRAAKSMAVSTMVERRRGGREGGGEGESEGGREGTEEVEVDGREGTEGAL